RGPTRPVHAQHPGHLPRLRRGADHRPPLAGPPTRHPPGAVHRPAARLPAGHQPHLRRPPRQRVRRRAHHGHPPPPPPPGSPSPPSPPPWPPAPPPPTAWTPWPRTSPTAPAPEARSTSSTPPARWRCCGGAPTPCPTTSPTSPPPSCAPRRARPPPPLPHDVADLAPDILRHRLVLTYQALAEQTTPDQIITAILTTIPTPRIDLTGGVAGGRGRRPAGVGR